MSLTLVECMRHPLKELGVLASTVHIYLEHIFDAAGNFDLRGGLIEKTNLSLGCSLPWQSRSAQHPRGRI
jgi:hypothetical protein